MFSVEKLITGLLDEARSSDSKCKVNWMNEKAKKNQPYIPTAVEHVANVITHGVWVFPSLWGSVLLLQRATTWSQYWAAFVYGSSLFLLFSVSTFFHSVFFLNKSRNLKMLLHRCDRAMIYVFIAASYFPWLMLRPLPPDGWVAELRWIIWVLASLGILYQQLFHEQYKWLETLFYLIMGICPSLAILSRVDEDFSGLTELKIGGAIYVIGVIFFKADGRIPCAHAIWHLHVVLAAAVHYYAIFTYLIIPP